MADRQEGVDPTREGVAAIQRGQTIHAWFDVTYYDGLWTFAQGCKTGEWPVEWCGQELPKVEATHA